MVPATASRPARRPRRRSSPKRFRTRQVLSRRALSRGGPATARPTPHASRAAGRPRGPASGPTLREPAITALAAGPASGISSGHGRNTAVTTQLPSLLSWKPAAGIRV